MRIVALGGTGFLSSAVVEAAREAGHEVVLVSRGRHGEPPRDDLAWVRADREDAEDFVEALAGVEADAVIDSCGYSVGGALAAARAFAGVPAYAYVSSISAYSGWPPGPVPDEDAPVFTPEDDLEEYGPMKAQSERVIGAAVREADGSFLAVRAGLLIGPRDRARRLTRWLHRIATFDRVAVPEQLEQPIALVDVRDLAAWMVRSVERSLDGPFNATGPVGMTTFGGLLELCREVVEAEGGRVATLVPVPEDELLAAEVSPWVDLPFWLPSEVASAAWQVGTARVHAEGLTHRPLAESLADTWAWMQASGFGEDPADADPVLTKLGRA